MARVSQVPAPASSASPGLVSQTTYNVKDYGAKGNAGVITDGMIASGSAVLTSASAKFVPGMVGLPIYVLGAAPGTTLLTTTVLSYQSSTQVTLASMASTDVISPGKSVTWGTDDTTSIQAAIDVAAAVGGGEVYIPTGRYLVSYSGSTPAFNHPSALRLKQSVRLRGAAGKWASILMLSPNSNCAVLSNAQADALYDQTLNSGNGAFVTTPTHGNAEFIAIMDLGIDGNKSCGMVKGPTAIPTVSTISGSPSVDTGLHLYAFSYQTSTSESPIGAISSTATVSSGQQVVIGGFSGLPVGGSRVGTGVNLYRTATNQITPLFLVHQFTWTDVDTILAGSGTWTDTIADNTLSQVARRGDGVLLGTNPFAPLRPNGVDTEYDPHQYLCNVYVRNCMNTGFYMYGLSATDVVSCHAYVCDQYGFRPTADASLTACHVGQPGLHGYYVETSAVRLIGCKAFYAGNIDNTQGAGFFFNKTFGIDAVGCEAQDNQGPGFNLNLTTNSHITGTADSNSKRGNGIYPAIEIFNSSYNSFNVRCFERFTSFTQTPAVRIRETADTPTNISIGNVVTADTVYVAGSFISTVLTPAVMDDSKTGLSGNKVTIGCQDGVHNAGSISGTFTPDVYCLGGHVYATVTGNLTIAAPAHPTSSSQHWGVELEFVLTASSSGPYTVTWNALYTVDPSDVSMTSIPANATLRVSFIWNGTKWIQRQQALPVGILGTQYGGTGVDTHTASNGQLLIGNGSGLSLANITAGSNITVTNSSGGITVAGSAGSSVWTKIAETVVGAGGVATITFSSIPQTYRILKLFLQGRASGTGAGEFARSVFVQLNDGVATGQSSSGSSEIEPGQFNVDYGGGFSGPTTLSLYIGKIARDDFAPTSHAGVIETTIYNYTSTTFFKDIVSANYTEEYQSITGHPAWSPLVNPSGATWGNTAAVTSLTLKTSGSGSLVFIQGTTVSLYGVT